MAEEKKVAEFHEVTPVGRRRMDPYNGVFVAPDDTFIMDANAAKMFEDMGEIKIVTKNVAPPWAAKVDAPAKEVKK